DEVAAKGGVVGEGEGGDVGEQEVRAVDRQRLQPRLAQDAGEQGPAGVVVGPQPIEVAAGCRLGDGVGGGLLEGGGVGEGDELVHAADGGGQRRRGDGPADLPPRHAEGLADAVDGDGALPHPRAGGQGDVAGAGEDQLAVDLVGDGDDVVLAAQLGDQIQLGGGEDLAGGVVRGVEDD